MRKVGKISLRQFDLGDLPKILKIEQEVFSQDPWPEKNFRFCYKRHPDGFVVAIINDKLVGFAVGWISKRRGGIGDIVVVDKYRRRGTGKLLVNYILNWLKQKKCTICQIEVGVDNNPAFRFFKKLEFKKVKKLPKFYATGEGAFLMTKEV